MSRFHFLSRLMKAISGFATALIHLFAALEEVVVLKEECRPIESRAIGFN